MIAIPSPKPISDFWFRSNKRYPYFSRSCSNESGLLVSFFIDFNMSSLSASVAPVAYIKNSSLSAFFASVSLISIAFSIPLLLAVLNFYFLIYHHHIHLFYYYVRKFIYILTQ